MTPKFALKPTQASKITREICAMTPVVPVLTINDVNTARPLAQALVAGGLTTLEITLRTPAALDVISAMSEIPEAMIGAGTLLTPDDMRAAKKAGASFGVSPGATDALLAACEDEGLPLLPGAATASEAMRLLERGYDMLKFFPAEASGGISALQAIGAPLPQISFCPTGGVNPANVEDYLSLANVICVGGSWVAPTALIDANDWGKIEALASEASRLGR